VLQQAAMRLRMKGGHSSGRGSFLPSRPTSTRMRAEKIYVEGRSGRWCREVCNQAVTLEHPHRLCSPTMEPGCMCSNGTGCRLYKQAGSCAAQCHDCWSWQESAGH
jgi:hypothetical protein